jgi:DnaK suppressor protein
MPASKPAVPAPIKPASPAKSAAAAGRAAAAAAAAAASASRFADRFAPPKPAARTVADHSLEVMKPAAKADPKLANAWKHKGGRELTEAELLAMPDAEYMNEKQLDFFRARLDVLKDDLLSNAGETTEHLREDTSIVPDPADRATIEEEHALELRTRDRERKLLKKISQSLARIEAGDYGYCDETGEPIGLGRLLARPTATLSLEAQQRRELKQKMFGD